jgi:hypothetical protein
MAILVVAIEDGVGARLVGIVDWEYLVVADDAGSALHPADFAAGVDCEEHLLRRVSELQRHEIFLASSTGRT